MFIEFSIKNKIRQVSFPYYCTKRLLSARRENKCYRNFANKKSLPNSLILTLLFLAILRQSIFVKLIILDEVVTENRFIFLCFKYK